mmetsp:Transcript_23644/g.39574  ORF Transcript_23644/g.39574 Transcript_23644/m.39574 type:complete len:388 (-) Transcript_23644:334-1497(-)
MDNGSGVLARVEDADVEMCKDDTDDIHSKQKSSIHSRQSSIQSRQSSIQSRRSSLQSTSRQSSIHSTQSILEDIANEEFLHAIAAADVKDLVELLASTKDVEEISAGLKSFNKTYLCQVKLTSSLIAFNNSNVLFLLSMALACRFGPNFVSEVLCSLQILSRLDANASELVQKIRIPAKIFSVLSNHVEHPKIAAHALSLLANLSPQMSEDDITCCRMYIRTVLEAHNQLPVVLAALQGLATSKLIHKHNDSCQMLELVCRSMHDFLFDAGVAIAGAKIFSKYISRCNTYHTYVLKFGGAELITSALETHLMDHSVVFHALSAVSLLLDKNDQSFSPIHITPLISTILCSHSTHAPIQKLANKILRTAGKSCLDHRSPAPALFTVML